jgi:hypothetical protein
MRMLVLFLVGLLSLLDCRAPEAWAETTQPLTPPPIIMVRTGVHTDFDRIVFDWPRQVKYTIHRDGTKIIIHFSSSAQLHIGTDFTHLSRARTLESSSNADGNLTVSFLIGSKATIKDFVSDKSVVIDILGASAPPQSPEAEVVNKGPSTSTSMAAPPVDAKPLVKTPPEASAAPVVGTTPAPPAVTPPPQPAPPTVPPPDLTPQATASPTPITVPETQAGPAPKSVPAATIIQVGTPPKTPAANPPSPNKTATVPSSDITDTPLLVASLDPHTAIRAAIFQRAEYAYIVFDRKITLDAETLAAGQPPLRVTLESLDMPKTSGFRFRVAADTELHATRDGTVWKIFLSRKGPDVPVSTSLVAQPDFALGARFLLPLPDAPEPIHFSDPVVGDELILVPLAQTEAFSVGRRMAEFKILSAAQGLVIKPLTDKIIVRAVSDGVEITAEGGLRLSSSNDTGASQQSSQKARAAASGKSLFDFAAWRGKPDETFTQTRQRLQQTIVDVPEAERNRARLELARFYFSHGYGEEASALLNWLAKQVPDLTAHADFMALMSASKILSYHAEDALKSLDAPIFAGQPEIELWQAVAQAELRNWAQAEEKFSNTESMLSGYPEPFYSRFSILAIEAALATGKDHEAADWLDQLENGPHREFVDPAIAYLHGVLHAKAGRANAAEQSWKSVEASDNRLYKIRAELALIDLGVSTGSLTPAQAADRLEALRFGWRGDDLEVDILHRLGQFYIQAKNIKAGLNILSRAVQLYPSSPMAPQIQNEMSSIFHDIFLSDLGKNLTPLDALTLYQQYRNLMPTGDDGISVTKNMAERLVAIDLLSQAADLLEDLVKNKLHGEEKGHIGARLAAIRLLDHKPDAALTALDYGTGENYSTDLQNERTLLRARALSDLHRDDEALSLLRDRNDTAANILRADITMHAQRWIEAAKTLLDLVGKPPKAGGVLNESQATWLVNCAIALSLAGDQAGIDDLALNYGAAMAGTPEGSTFQILTQPEKGGQLHDIAAAQAKIADVDMFQGFLNNYRKTDPAKK